MTQITAEVTPRTGRRIPQPQNGRIIMNAHTEIFGPGTTVDWLGGTFRILLTPAETEGRLGMFEAVVPPGFGPPRHIHSNEDETVLILKGEVRYWLAGEIFERRAGDVVFLPRGKEHTFKIIGETPARLIGIVTPGGFEAFFPTVAKRKISPPEDAAQFAAIAASFGSEFTGPPLP
jgi:quercetin dioxygenase-like cupin family protein